MCLIMMSFLSMKGVTTVKKENVNCYEKNDTMRLLGLQTREMFNNDMLSQMDDIMKARPYSATYESALDIFTLGFIFGKRSERAKKKKFLKHYV